MSQDRSIKNLNKLFDDAVEGKIDLNFSCTPEQAIELLNFFKKIKKVD